MFPVTESAFEARTTLENAIAYYFMGSSGFGVHHRTRVNGMSPKINEPFVRSMV